ncbi:hypothetical protein [Bradyrhizobium sp. dw_78]|uniref:hypothetical protein n=1 Tax=Bradyrhizobium sp. dw_78 TaxID=2719793 RepID=UPI001BD379D1|nr:hypothetical protein [Bradyrhizobium sp. dw_78]
MTKRLFFFALVSGLCCALLLVLYHVAFSDLGSGIAAQPRGCRELAFVVAVAAYVCGTASFLSALGFVTLIGRAAARKHDNISAA